MEPRQKGLKSASAKIMMSVSIVERGFLVTAIIVGYEARFTHFPWSIEPSTSLAPFVASYNFYNCDLSFKSVIQL
jgi:hypothetical protein